MIIKVWQILQFIQVWNWITAWLRPRTVLCWFVCITVYRCCDFLEVLQHYQDNVMCKTGKRYLSIDFLLIEHWDKNQNLMSYIYIQENWILKFSSVIWQPFCLDPNVPISPRGPHNEINLFSISLSYTKLMMSQIHPGTFQKTRRSVQRRHTGAANCSRRHSSCGNQQRYLAWKEPHFDCRSLGGTNHKERPWAVTTTDCKYMGLGDVTKRSNITRYCIQHCKN